MLLVSSCNPDDDHTEQDFEEMELKEVSEVIVDFFTGISESLNGLSGKMQVKAARGAN